MCELSPETQPGACLQATIINNNVLKEVMHSMNYFIKLQNLIRCSNGKNTYSGLKKEQKTKPLNLILSFL